MIVELVKKTLFTGIGLASLGKDKIEELAKDVAKYGEMSEAEASKFLEELRQRADAAQDDLRDRIDKRVEQVTQQLELARTSEVQALQAKVTALAAQVEVLEGRVAELSRHDASSNGTSPE